MEEVRGLLCERAGRRLQWVYLGGSPAGGKDKQRAEATRHTGLATASILFLTQESRNKHN